MKNYNNRLREGIFDAFNDVTDDEFKNAYIKRINSEYNNFLEKVSTNPNFAFVLRKNVTIEDYGDKNRCATNTFRYVKEKLMNGETNYFPVGGYFFMAKSLSPIEHWWVYNSNTNQHIEVTPMDGDRPWAYGGIIEKSINDDILKVNNVFDIEFFKGGYIYYNYLK